MIKRIVAIGPESTGKSTLCAQLAAHYKTGWVKEYAREYLLANGTAYSFDNLLDVAKGQLELEDVTVGNYERESIQHLSHAPATRDPTIIFIDTDMYVLKVWCEFVFDRCHQWILNKIVERKYDLYLLCDIDLPWVKDKLREYPDLPSRKKLYHYYKDILVNQPVPWVSISGDYKERFQKAVKAVDELSNAVFDKNNAVGNF